MRRRGSSRERYRDVYTVARNYISWNIYGRGAYLLIVAIEFLPVTFRDNISRKLARIFRNQAHESRAALSLARREG